MLNDLHSLLFIILFIKDARLCTKSGKNFSLGVYLVLISLDTNLENKFEILSSGFDRIPTTVKKLTEEQEADVNKLLEKIEDDDDVQNVYHNMQE